jgi:hypothetical protein
MKKGNKVLFIIIAVVIVLGIGAYKIGSDMTSPKRIAKDYIKAVIGNDNDKLYGYLEIDGDKTFVSKKIFKEIMKDRKTEVDNFSITDVEYGEGKLTAKVKFSYTTKKDTSEKTDYVSLTKQKGKKYLIFDDWKLSANLSNSLITKDYSVVVPKNAKIEFAGVEVAEKYLDKDKATDTTDTYVLPQVYMTETTIKITLDNGIEFEKSVTPSTYYNSVNVKFDEDSLSDDEKETLTDNAKKIIGNLYENAIAGKKYDDIKSDYEKASKKLEDNYNTFVSDIESATNKLKSFSVTSVSIYDLSLNDDGDMEVEFKVNYDYEVEYTNYKNETLTSEKSNYGYMTIVVTKDKNGYELVNIKELKTYFYR